MARFFGKVGYAVEEEKRPGVWINNQIREVDYIGDVVNVRYKHNTSDKITDDLGVTDEISILADEFAFEHCSNIKYVWYIGARWKVTSVKVRRPRIILQLGGIYNGESTSNG